MKSRRLAVSAVFLLATTVCLANDDANGVAGKTYVNSDGDTIAFYAHGKAKETNGVGGTMYSYQSGMFRNSGFFSSDCTYSQNGNKVDLTCEGAKHEKVAYAVNGDGSLTGPPTGMYGHKAFAHLTEKTKK